MIINFRTFFIRILLLVAVLSVYIFAQAKEPPNNPAQVSVQNKIFRIVYDGIEIFSGELSIPENDLRFNVITYKDGKKNTQVIQFTTLDWNKKLKITGVINGSGESFPCQVDRQNRGPLIVSNSNGISRNLLNRSVYDRKNDWVLSIDFNPKVLITSGQLSEDKNTFNIESEGHEIVLRFKPRYYQFHRGLEFFEPWNYKVWNKSVAGWISWFAFYDKVTERDMIETADIFSETLKPFGFEYFQMDDGYQQIQGPPEKWLNPNKKFPNGLKYLADYIKNKGLKPGIWTAASVFTEDYVNKNLDFFIKDRFNKAARGNWIEYIIDASNPKALKEIVQPLYKGLIDMGWEYFKVDGLRHLRYEGYNANRKYFENKKIDLIETYRKYGQIIRNEIGREKFILGCWGIRPELIGIIDGCRIGDDGFSYAGLSQYNSFNNIVWRNDPDHIELNEDAYRSTMVTSLTGSLFMLTDKPEVYRTNVSEPAKRTVPVLFTRPTQIFDVDPSRSDNLWRVNSEVSGSGPRQFDAGYSPICHLYQLEISRLFDYWNILGRTGGDFNEIKFSDLGLNPKSEYFVFEFWTKKMLGSFSGSFNPGQIDPKYKSQVFAIRERKPYPQLIATSRHITCGGIDIINLEWNGKNLIGKSKPVSNDPYILYITETDKYIFDNFECANLKAEKIDKEGNLLKILLLPKSNQELDWKITYKMAE